MTSRSVSTIVSEIAANLRLRFGLVCREQCDLVDPIARLAERLAGLFVGDFAPLAFPAVAYSTSSPLPRVLASLLPLWPV